MHSYNRYFEEGKCMCMRPRWYLSKRYVAGWLEGIEGRYVQAKACMWLGEKVCVVYLTVGMCVRICAADRV